MAIQKIIHYCWFGGNPKPDKMIKCINSWKKYCPDYTIVEWNEHNYDVNKHSFVREAYKRKKWAFVSDYARLEIIYNNGGVYLDTDVEIIKPIDELLSLMMFAGFENKNYVNFGLGFGAIKKHPYLLEIMNEYDKISFPDDDTLLAKIACPTIQTTVLKEHGLITNDSTQQLGQCMVYNSEYFSPKDYESGEIHVTPNTYSIHHFEMSWFSKEDIEYREIKWKLKKKYNSNIIIGFLLILTKVKQFPIKLRKKYHQGGTKELTKYLRRLLQNVAKKIFK